MARTSSSAFSRPLRLSVPCLACPPKVTEIARAWELRVPPSCSPGPGTRCGDTVSPSKKTEARRAAVGRPRGINGRPQNNRSHCKDRWRAAGLIPARLCLQRWGRRAQRMGQTTFLPRGTHFLVRKTGRVRERRAGQRREAETEAGQGSRRGSGWARVRKGTRKGPHTGDVRPCS